MIYIKLAFEFFKTGLFAFGGGYATVPFLFQISEVYKWFSLQELTQMTAIAAITPGPVGINVATYAGLKTAGILGSFIATIAEVLPSFFIVILVYKILNKFHDNFYVNTAIQTLKPISCALLLSVSINMIKNQINDLYDMAILSVLIVISLKTNKNPIFYMFIAAIAGIFVHKV